MASGIDPYELFLRSESKRDNDWEFAVLQAFPQMKLRLHSEDPVVGPDGWPYLAVHADPSGGEPAGKVLTWLSERGIGLVVNPKEDAAPDFVLTYGMVWNFRETGAFISPSDTAVQGQIKFEQGTNVLAGPPSSKFLPDYVRAILREFFKQQQVLGVKVLVMSRDKKHYDLCFSVESLGNPDRSEHRGVLEALSWFLPPHYSLMMISEKGLPPFHAL